MARTQATILRLLLSTALSGCLVGPVLAQAADSGGRSSGASEDLLGEVVVTATRQADTVNRVPLSVSAVTQRSLDQQGIKSVADLQRTVPALSVTASTTGAISNFSIRGILATSGAPTTGVYLDDVPLQKRNALSVAQSNGSPAPPLFDLERVEVLRGPQGTLYGGSSQGGTIRFLTPQPSLTRYSGYGRAEASATHYGSASYEAGFAFGGPIIKDKLGFRASAWFRKNGGWVDMRDPYIAGNPVRSKDANNADIHAYRAAVTWRPTERASATLSYYSASETDEGGPSSAASDTAAFETPQACFRGSTAAVACTTPGAYVRPAQTYGPFDLGPYDSLEWMKSPFITTLDVGSLTVDYGLDWMNVKLISSYIRDKTKGFSPESAQVSGSQRSVLLFRPFPNYAGEFRSQNKRQGTIQEVRLSSVGDPKPFSWVVGAYYSAIDGRTQTLLPEDVDSINQLLFGISALQRYGVPILPGGSISSRIQNLLDTELAAFGEVNYWITDKLKVTGGVRASKVQFKFDTIFSGPLSGFTVPNEANGGVVFGKVTESPISPKVGLQYQLSDNDMVYLSAAKGFRAGGVNPSVTQSVCGAGLALVGLTSADIPRTYDADTVWSYEGGAKVRVLGGRAQLNASVFRIDWSNVQFTVGIPGCGVTYVQNAATAVSQGFDLQSQLRIVRGLTASLALGYTDAKYTETVSGPKPLNGAATPVVQKGDVLAVPPWQVSFGLQSDFQLAANIPAYIRGDVQYASSYFRGLGPGVNAYSPDTREADAVSRVNLRAGIELKGWDVNVFVNNLLESRDQLTRSGGRSGCSIPTGAACTTFTNFNPVFTSAYFRPRECGLQAAYRF